MSPEYADLVEREVSLCALRRSFFNRDGARLAPRAQRRRALSLLEALSLFSPDDVEEVPRHAFLTLARLAWRRPPWSWTGEGGWAGLCAHLLVGVRYPLPGFLFSPPLEGGHRPTDPNKLDLLAHLGGGGSTREAVARGLLPQGLTRRMQHALWSVEAPLPLVAAVRVAQVRALGGPPWLEEALMGTALAQLGTPEQERARVELLDWLSRHGDGLPPERLPEVVGWWCARTPEQRRPAAHYALARVLDAAQGWQQRHEPWRRPLQGPLPDGGIEDTELSGEEGTWQICQLRRAEQLVAEGVALRHCVATYHALVVGRVSVIYGLRLAGRRRLTVEVRPEQAAIVQVRGLCNRPPGPKERDVLARWAAAHQLEMRAV